ncbi:MAG: SPOR domain-containing protein [Leucothrix sp.]
MPRRQNKITPLSKQNGLAIKTILIVLVGIVLLGLGYKYLERKNFYGFNTKTITAPIQNINPFKENNFGGFGVQVIATTSLTEAKRVMNKFAFDGYSSFIVQVTQRGNPLYLVRLGPYTRAEAVAVNDKIKRRYKKSPYVRKSFVTYREG